MGAAKRDMPARLVPPRTRGAAKLLKSILKPIDVYRPGTYSTQVHKNRLTTLLLAFTVFAVQTSGVHVHAHKSSGAAEISKSNFVHLALATDHNGDQGKHHDRDTELSPPDNGILKKAGSDQDLVALPTLRHAPHAPLHLGDKLISAAGNFPELQTPDFTHPLLRAPPAFHSV